MRSRQFREELRGDGLDLSRINIIQGRFEQTLKRGRWTSGQAGRDRLETAIFTTHQCVGPTRSWRQSRGALIEIEPLKTRR